MGNLNEKRETKNGRRETEDGKDVRGERLEARGKESIKPQGASFKTKDLLRNKC
jgi:hypothetical protein